MKKIFLTEADRKKIISDKEKAIVESFAKTFNSIKRIDENELDENNSWEEEQKKKELKGRISQVSGSEPSDEEMDNVMSALKMGKENKINEMGGDTLGDKETIYIDNDLSDYFGVPYQNEGEETIINSGALKNRNNRRSWDSKHLAIFDKYAGKDLLLKGKGYGWWEIVNAR